MEIRYADWDWRTSRCAARLARKALCTSRALLGGRLSLRLRPRLDDMAGEGEGLDEVDRMASGPRLWCGVRGGENAEGSEESGAMVED